MDVKAFQYLKDKGWNIDTFPPIDSSNTLILVFAAPHFINNPEPIQQLAAQYPQAKMIGCSSAGEICGSRIFDDSLSVVIIQFQHTQLKIVQAQVNDSKDSYAAGESITDQLNHDNLRSIFVLSDGLNVNGSELVKGLNAHAGKDTIITGGLAADGSAFKKTWTIFNGEILDKHVVAVGLYGNHLCVGHASRGGWDIFGPARRITRSKGNILYELDNQPALLLYKEYLGERANELPASGLLYPLAIRDNTPNNPVQLVRTILGVDEKEQALIFAGDMPMGYQAQLMRANFDRLITSANEAGELARSNLCQARKSPTKAILAISVSCVGRRLLLGERTEEETESTLDALPPGSTQIGFYSYGELSPFMVGNCELHNQTMTLTTYCENE